LNFRTLGGILDKPILVLNKRPLPKMYLKSVAAVAIALAETSNAYPRDASAATSSIVKGKTFDRFVSIWLENTDYDKAAGDRGFLFHFK
jgi:hypothetical protein